VKIYFLGTCSGTEPVPNRRHASVAVECGGKVYIFDAGEGCSHTAYNLGIDFRALTKVIISHPHIDHFGGLANLLWVPRKLYSVTKLLPYYGDIDVYIPDMEIWGAVDTLLNIGSKRYGKTFDAFRIHAHGVQAGVLFDDGTLKVTAFENNHIPFVDGKCQSFSYLLEGEGKRVVYSGDVKSPFELSEAVGDHCDLMTMETGHHKIETVYQFFAEKNIDALYFTHHGRTILDHEEACKKQIKELFGGKAFVAYDGMTVEL